MVSTSNERYPESEDRHMRMNKLFMGLALGVTLAAGTASTAEAKAKPVVVTVDKADASTARKVDAAFKKGKAVTLKVRGSKKASKKLLEKLQVAVSKVNVFGARFDLDNGDEKYAGKGNVFQTYSALNYKQSGSYGCYTITKSSANAYKYYLLGVNKLYKEQTACLSQKAYNAMVADLKSESTGDYTGNIMGKLCDFAEGYLEEHHAGFATDEMYDACDVIVRSVLDMEVTSDEVEAMQGYFAKKESIPDFYNVLMEQVQVYKDEAGELSMDIPSRYEYAVERLGQSVADYYFGKASYINPREKKFHYVGWRHYDSRGSWDNTIDWHLYYGTDEYRMKELYKGTKGVCADLAVCDRLCFDYVGIKSYYVANMEANHAVCFANSKEWGITGKMYVGDNVGGDGTTYVNGKIDNGSGIGGIVFCGEDEYRSYFDGNTWDSAWDKLVRDAMGDDYPF